MEEILCLVPKIVLFVKESLSYFWDKTVILTCSLGQATLEFDIWRNIHRKEGKFSVDIFEIIHTENKKTGRERVLLRERGNFNRMDEQTIEEGKNLQAAPWKGQLAIIFQHVETIYSKWAAIYEAEETRKKEAHRLFLEKEKALIDEKIAQGLLAVLFFVKERINRDNSRDDVCLGGENVDYGKLVDFFQKIFPNVPIEEDGDYSDPDPGCTFELILRFPSVGGKLFLSGERGEDNTDCELLPIDWKKTVRTS
jgi:hypothetical protein